MKKTALQKVVDILTEEYLLTHESWQGIFEDALAENKQELIEAYVQGLHDIKGTSDWKDENAAIAYFEKTYVLPETQKSGS